MAKMYHLQFIQSLSAKFKITILYMHKCSFQTLFASHDTPQENNSLTPPVELIALFLALEVQGQGLC
jgi:hypothetical protein